METGLFSPWVRYVGRLRKTFELDPKVRVEYDDAYNEVTLFVEGTDKAEALTMLLPSDLEFGNVTLKITVRPSNDELTEEAMFVNAFEGNPCFVDVMGGFGPDHDVSYALFKPECVQVMEDDISEYCGYKTMTYAQLVKSVLNEGGVKISSAQM